MNNYAIIGYHTLVVMRNAPSGDGYLVERYAVAPKNDEPIEALLAASDSECQESKRIARYDHAVLAYTKLLMAEMTDELHTMSFEASREHKHSVS